MLRTNRPVVPVTLRTADGDGLQVTLDLGPVVEAIAAQVEARVARLLEAERVQAATTKALSVPEAADALGVSENTVGRMIADGRLSSLKVGARRVVPRSAIDQYLQAGHEAS